MKNFTRDDFVIEHGRTMWGSAEATLTLRKGVAERTRNYRTFTLQSTQDHPLIPKSHMPQDGNGIVARAGGMWLGTYEHFDMEQAIEDLLAWLSAESVKEDFTDEWHLLDSVLDAFQQFHDSLEWGARRNYLEEWANVRAAVAVIEVRLSSYLLQAEPVDHLDRS